MENYIILALAIAIIIWGLVILHKETNTYTVKRIHWNTWRTPKKASQKDIDELTMLINKLLEWMTQTELAKRIWVSQRAISQLHNAKISRPSSIKKYLLVIREQADLILPNIK